MSRFPEREAVDALKAAWTDKRVRVKPGIRAELARFEGKVGRIVTVNYAGRAIVDFADGAWYDCADFPEVLEVINNESEAAKYNATVNSAQPRPNRQS